MRNRSYVKRRIVLAIVGVIAYLVFAANKECVPPKAAFSWRVSGMTVSFVNETTGSDTLRSTYWNFGDGHSSASKHAEHTYAGPGTYVVTLLVGNACGNDRIQKKVTVVGLNSCVPSGFTAGPPPLHLGSARRPAVRIESQIGRPRA
jgi:PKD repeat protein